MITIVYDGSEYEIRALKLIGAQAICICPDVVISLNQNIKNPCFIEPDYTRNPPEDVLKTTTGVFPMIKNIPDGLNIVKAYLKI